MGLSLLTPAIVMVVANVQVCVEVAVSLSSYKTKESLGEDWRRLRCRISITVEGVFDISAAETLRR